MTVGVFQVTNINVILRAIKVIRINGRVFFVVSAHFQKEARHIQIFFVFGVAVKLNQCQLDFLVAGRHKACRVFYQKYALNQITIALHDFEKTISAGCLVISDGSFDEVSCAVELVAVAIREDQMRIDLLMLGIEISVITLCMFHTFYQFFAKCLVLVHILFALFNEVSNGFHPFCNVRIKKVVRAFSIFVIVKAQCIKATGFLKAFSNVGEGDGCV